MFARIFKTTVFLLLAVSAVQAKTARPAKSAANGAALESQFRAAGRSIPSRLMNLGYQNFGQLDLSRLVNDMESIRVVSASAAKVGAENDDGRITARWTKSDQTILVNTGMWSRYANMRETLALHEFLSILGFADSEYRISERLWTLSLPEAQGLRDDERQAIVSQINRYTNVQYAGGVVGVGGGGESTTLYVRGKRIQDSLNRMNSAQDSATREEASGDLEGALNSQLTASYMQMRSPKAKKASQDRVKEMFAHPLCMTHTTTCPVKNTNAAFCTCGSETDGLIIYPHD